MEPEFRGLIVMIILIALVVVMGIFDCSYRRPLAEETANQYCKDNGFDQVKDFTRRGLFSKEPIAIKCEYAERFTDIGVRSTEATN